jgi:hypothetical protein
LISCVPMVFDVVVVLIGAPATYRSDEGAQNLVG